MLKGDLAQFQEISRWWAYEWLNWSASDGERYLGAGTRVRDLVPISFAAGALTIIRPQSANVNEQAVFLDVRDAAKKFGIDVTSIAWLDATPIEWRIASIEQKASWLLGGPRAPRAEDG